MNELSVVEERKEIKRAVMRERGEQGGRLLERRTGSAWLKGKVRECVVLCMNGSESIEIDDDSSLFSTSA